jgi:adenylate cyclase
MNAITPGRAAAPRWPRVLLLLLPLVWALLHVTGGLRLQGIDRLDALMQDTRLQLTLPRTQDPRIVIVDIDEKSLGEIGRWPWRRDQVARLLDELFDRQEVALVGFGRPFDAPDDSSGLTRLRALADHELRDVPAYARQLRVLEARLDHDGQLARALADRPVVLGFHFTRDAPGQTAGVLPAPAMAADRLQGRPVQVAEWSGYSANIERLAAAAPVAGFLEPLTDPDGRVRAMPLLARHAGQYYETLALAMYRTLSGGAPIEPVFPQDRFPPRDDVLSHLLLRQGATTMSVPVGDGVTARLPYLGPGGPGGGSFRYVSAADLLAARLPAGDLQGKLVLVGATAAGLDAQHVTPVGTAYPAIELHATLLSGLIEGRLRIRPDYVTGYGLVVLLGTGLLLALALPAVSGPQATLLLAAVIAGILGLNYWLFDAAGLAFPLAPALLTATASYALHMGSTYLMHWRGRREFVRLLGAYVPPELARQMLDDPHRCRLEAASRHLTVMFCDIRGFTRLAESLEPAALQAFLQRVFSRLTEVVRQHGGTIDKYIGDCVMAFWGAPGEVPDHAQRAVAASLALTHALQALNAEHRLLGLPEVEVGIGVNTGLMCVGDMGSPQRSAYTVVGDAVNLAARLERLSARYGVTVVAGEATCREADDVVWQELDKVRVKGKARAVAIYTPRAAGLQSDASVADELRTWAAFLKAYRAQDVVSCERMLASLPARADTQVLYALYAQRLAQMRRQPADPSWDGVTPAQGD